MRNPRQVFTAAFVACALQRCVAYTLAAAYPAPQNGENSVPAPSLCSDGATIKDMWMVERLSVTYTADERVQQGNASWTITNTLTNTTQRLHCALRMNFVCELDGTPANKALDVWLQLNIDVASVTFNDSLPCGNEETTGTLYAVGTAQLYLTCPDEADEAGLSCSSDGDAKGYADGSVVLQPPVV